MHWTKTLSYGQSEETHLRGTSSQSYQVHFSLCDAGFYFATTDQLYHLEPWTLNIWTSTFGILATYNAFFTIYKHCWPTASVSVVLRTFFWHYKIQLFWDLWHWHKEKKVLLFFPFGQGRDLWGCPPPVAGMWEHYCVMSPFDFITPVLHHPTELPPTFVHITPTFI